jgi:hypothetical protein
MPLLISLNDLVVSTKSMTSQFLGGGLGRTRLLRATGRSDFKFNGLETAYSHERPLLLTEIGQESERERGAWRTLA